MNGLKIIEKTCGFFVSEAHFAVMILPYIKNEIENNKTIVTFLEQDISESVSLLLAKLNLPKETKQKVESIRWNSRKLLKYSDIQKDLKKVENKIILVGGRKDYIEKVNKNVERYLVKNKLYLKIVNCYDINSIDKNTKEILKKHDYILNTSGEKRIDEAFAINQ